MKNWLIKRLGGFTREEHTDLYQRYAAVPAVWDEAIKALEAEGRLRNVSLVSDYCVYVDHPHIEGALLLAPFSRATLIGSYSEGTYLPVDSEGRIH